MRSKGESHCAITYHLGVFPWSPCTASGCAQTKDARCRCAGYAVFRYNKAKQGRSIRRDLIKRPKSWCASSQYLNVWDYESQEVNFNMG
jgi:hypothetical protein